MPSVHLHNLTKRFGDIVALDNVTLDIPDGALYFLLGPSGCGKTTLLRVLAGFLEPEAGTIRLGSRDITNLPPAQRNTALCFQNYALWPHLSVAENVAFGLSVRKIPPPERKNRVKEALELVHLSEYAQRKPNELSGGQQQRVALARALVVKPDVLLLDEPLSNLDAQLRQEMRAQIRTICKEAGLTSVYVTHDQKEALSIADGIAVLRDGKLIQQGPPAQLYRQPASRFVAQFLGEANFLTTVVGRVQDREAVLQTPAGLLHSANLPADIKTGQQVLACIRPETVRLLPAGTAVGANILPAQYVSRTYLGEIAQHQLKLADGSAFKVFELHPPVNAPAPGSTLCVGFAVEDVVVLHM